MSKKLYEFTEKCVFTLEPKVIIKIKMVSIVSFDRTRTGFVVRLTLNWINRTNMRFVQKKVRQPHI